MILVAGWPFHLGAITPYLDRTGISERGIGRPLALSAAELNSGSSKFSTSRP